MGNSKKVRFHILPKEYFERVHDGTQRVIVTVDDHTKQEIVSAAENNTLSDFDIICVETDSTYKGNTSLEKALEALTGRFMVLIPVDAVGGMPGLHADGVVLTVAVAERAKTGAKEIVAHAKKAAEPEKKDELQKEVKAKPLMKKRGKKKKEPANVYD